MKEINVAFAALRSALPDNRFSKNMSSMTKHNTLQLALSYIGGLQRLLEEEETTPPTAKWKDQPDSKISHPTNFCSKVQPNSKLTHPTNFYSIDLETNSPDKANNFETDSSKIVDDDLISESEFLNVNSDEHLLRTVRENHHHEPRGEDEDKFSVPTTFFQRLLEEGSHELEYPSSYNGAISPISPSIINDKLPLMGKCENLQSLKLYQPTNFFPTDLESNLPNKLDNLQTDSPKIVDEKLFSESEFSNVSAGERNDNKLNPSDIKDIDEVNSCWTFDFLFKEDLSV